jgi:16S rRNA (cytosine1402-N4)-methyltransferase
MSAQARDGVHLPVMVDEVLRLLDPQKGETFLDLTVGAGGHALEIASRLGPDGNLVGVDLDERILEVARERLSAQGLAKARLYQGTYAQCRRVLEEAGVERVDGILLDLGVSSLQIDDPERGFSFSEDGPLDMRMDATVPGETAADIVNEAREEELADIFYKYGEERLSRRIARSIVRERERRPITRTLELADIVRRAYGGRRQRIHPATRVFQALRIAVNDELENLRRALEVAPDILADGGRIAVIAFHSLEDRIVKEDFRTRARQGLYSVLTKKPLSPTDEETARNPRSRSAKLRAAKRSAR